MRYCEGCAAEVTETDYEAGECTQCHEPLTSNAHEPTEQELDDWYRSIAEPYKGAL